jgi:hypothetical protein
MILELVRQGRSYLEQGKLVRAKETCQQIAQYLDFYLISDEDWQVVDSFLKETLLMQKIAEWKERGRPEYTSLNELAKERESSAEDEIQHLESYLK